MYYNVVPAEDPCDQDNYSKDEENSKKKLSRCWNEGYGEDQHGEGSREVERECCNGMIVVSGALC